MSKFLRVLLVEDSEDDALLVIRELKKGGYEPEYERVETAEAMRTVLSEKTWDVILCDYNLPRFNGLDALNLCQEGGIDVPFIIVSGTIGEETAVEAMKAGAHDYVMKDRLSRLVPAIERELRETESRLQRKQAEKLYKTLAESSLSAVFIVQDGKFRFINTSAINYAGYSSEEIIGKSADAIVHPEDKEMVKERGRKMLHDKDMTPFEYRMVTREGDIRWIMQIVSSIEYEGKRSILGNAIAITGLKRAEEDRRQSIDKLRKMLGATVQAMAVAVETRDPYTAGLQRRVADLARTIATELGLSGERTDGLRMASLIHDIGKISVPAEILSKPTRLTEIEYRLIKTHSQSGYDILKDIEFPWPIARIILEHHERINGSGYPNGLTGDNLLVESKILAVADVVEAIASHRPYRAGLGMNAALDEIMKNRGIMYDAAAVNACIGLFKEKGYRFE